jgi:hypothetical protein
VERRVEDVKERGLANHHRLHPELGQISQAAAIQAYKVP